MAGLGSNQRALPGFRSETWGIRSNIPAPGWGQSALDWLSWLAFVLNQVLPQLSKYTLFLAHRVHQFLFESSAGWVVTGLESIEFQGGQLCEVAEHVFYERVQAGVF
jgi:hypothetical protein